MEKVLLSLQNSLSSLSAGDDFSQITDNLRKQFGHRSGPTKCWARSVSKLFDTMMLILNIVFEKVNFKKKYQQIIKYLQNTQHAKSYQLFFLRVTLQSLLCLCKSFF